MLEKLVDQLEDFISPSLVESLQIREVLEYPTRSSAKATV